MAKSATAEFFCGKSGALARAFWGGDSLTSGLLLKLALAVAMVLLIAPAVSFAQTQSHPLSQVSPIDTNLDLNSKNITSLSYLLYSGGIFYAGSQGIPSADIATSAVTGAKIASGVITASKLSNPLGGSVNASAYYDSDNSNYYLDPASTSTAMKLAGDLDLEDESIILRAPSTDANAVIRGFDWFGTNHIAIRNGDDSAYKPLHALHFYTHDGYIYDSAGQAILKGGGDLLLYAKTKDSSDIWIRSGNDASSYTDELQIDTSANVIDVKGNDITNIASLGVGSMSPVKTVDIVGDLNVTGTIYGTVNSTTGGLNCDQCVDTTDIANNAVTSSKIADGSITSSDISNPLGGSLNATAYYDSSNSNYYLDPASSGVSLEIAGLIRVENNFGGIDFADASGAHQKTQIFTTPSNHLRVQHNGINPLINIDENGNIGINSIVSGRTLWVNDRDSDAVIALNSSDSSYDPWIGFFTDGAQRYALWRDRSDGSFNLVNGGFTSSNKLVTVTSAGLVGINNTDPSYTLDVGGDIKTQDKFVVGIDNNDQINSEEAWLYRAIDRPEGTLTVQLGGDSATSTKFEIVDRAWTKIIAEISGEADSNSFIIQPDGDAIFNGGNVGVGTLTPANTLNVIGDINATGTLYGTLASGSVVASSIASGAVSSTKLANPLGGSVNGTAYYDSDNSNYYLDPASSGDALILAGSVGVGTTDPQGKLHVSGGSYVTDEGEMFKRYESGWTPSEHDVLFNAWTASTGDYVYLKAAGNSGSSEGAILVSDSLGLIVGRHSAEGGVADSATAPFANDNYARIGSTSWITGSLGVGTTGPARKLDVHSDLSVRNQGSNTQLALISTGGSNYIQSGAYSFGSGNAPLAITGQNAQTGSVLSVNFATTQYVGGNVVINNTNLPTLYLKGNLGGARYYGLGENSGYFSISDYGTTLGAGSYRLRIASDGTIDIPGDVGIGVTDPSFPLEVAGDARVGKTDARHYLKISSSQWPEIRFETPSYNEVMRFGSAHQDSSTYGVENGDIYAYSQTTNTMDLVVKRTGGVLLSPKGGGNVGINTTSPVKTLDVVGTVNATEAVCIAGDCRTEWGEGVDAAFGDGSDGTLAVSSGTTTLNSDKDYTAVNVSAGATLDTNGFTLRVTGGLVNNGNITDSASGGSGGVGGVGVSNGGDNGDAGGSPTGLGGYGGGGGGQGGTDSSSTGAGGDGGKGGGHVKIYAFAFINNGVVDVSGEEGEDGSNHVSGPAGGGGGGGGGGTLELYVHGAVYVGTVNITGGAAGSGGTSSGSDSAWNGGSGGNGGGTGGGSGGAGGSNGVPPSGGGNTTSTNAGGGGGGGGSEFAGSTDEGAPGGRGGDGKVMIGYV